MMTTLTYNARRLACLGASAVILLAPRAQAQQKRTDALAGRWELNVARSHYGGGAEPRVREVFDCTVRSVDVNCTIESVRQDGRSLTGGFAAAYGGAPGVTHGIPDVDHAQLVRVSNTISDATFTLRGKRVFAYRAVRSSDGRSLTIVAVAPDTRRVLNSVIVYDRR